MKTFITILIVFISLSGIGQCVTGTPPTLTCGTPITVADGTASGAYGTVSTSAPSCRTNEKYTYSDIYQVVYQAGMVIDVDCELYLGFLEVLSLDGCTSYSCGSIDATGVNISGESFVQDGTSQNGLLRFTMGLDDIGLTAGQTYLIKYASISNCGGSTCTSATVGTARGYTISCHTSLANSCENNVQISGGTTYSITNQYTSDNGGDYNGAGIDCGYSVESNLMYYWCTDASNTSVDVVLTNVVINAGTNIQFSIISDDCGGDFTDIQCEGGISADQTFTVTGTSASTCYWLTFDGNAGTWFDLDVAITNAIILPIELVGFTGSEINGDVVLKWTTASEINNDVFELYWSNDGENWELIGTKEGAGNSSQMIPYYMKHHNPEEVNYYRLKQIDFDGKYTVSRIISVTISIEVINKDYIYFNGIGQEITKETYKLYMGPKFKREKI